MNLLELNEFLRKANIQLVKSELELAICFYEYNGEPNVYANLENSSAVVYNHKIRNLSNLESIKEEIKTFVFESVGVLIDPKLNVIKAIAGLRR